jgi:hypothetical protein
MVLIREIALVRWYAELLYFCFIIFISYAIRRSSGFGGVIVPLLIWILSPKIVVPSRAPNSGTLHGKTCGGDCPRLPRVWPSALISSGCSKPRHSHACSRSASCAAVPTRFLENSTAT